MMHREGTITNDGTFFFNVIIRHSSTDGDGPLEGFLMEEGSQIMEEEMKSDLLMNIELILLPTKSVRFPTLGWINGSLTRHSNI